ncbi:MAG: CRISPR-associated endonuclease Cas1 [Candidatus Aminicenantes bacterium]|nr:CRISPR-associated endonuclease Cas1 [Candidatus Aminicenantes bacterium]
MKANMTPLERLLIMNPMPNSLAIFGYAPKAADFALRKVLKFRDCRGPVLIIDYQGRAAAVLDKTNMMNLNHRPVFWYDLADRLHPIHLFHLDRSDCFRPLIRDLLKMISRVKSTSFSEKVLDWAAEAAYQMSNNGTVTLGAMLKSFSSPAIRRWFLDTQPDPTELNCLMDLLQWALRYPLVYAVSEGTNRRDLLENIKRPDTTWIEIRSEYFEKYERGLVTVLVETAVKDALWALQPTHASPAPTEIITVVHFFPSRGLHVGVPDWIKDTSPWVRHIGVHSLESARTLDELAIDWSIKAGQIWILGGFKIPMGEVHRKWLESGEIEQVNGLAENFMLIRNTSDHNRLVVKIAPSRSETQEAIRQRHKAAKELKLTNIRQYSTAISLCDATSMENEGLYEKLCSVEGLRLGWFKVWGGKKDSHGIDNQTIGMFEENLASELKKLSDELLSRIYRSRPLRRVLIPKDDGGTRPLGLPCVRDRVVQSACLILLDQIFDPTFSHFSFGFRNQRSAHQAIALTRSMIKGGGNWAVIADIKKCFDTLDHDVLLNLVAAKIHDPSIIDLIQKWLTIEVLDFYEFIPSDVGVPQGESLSPFLANVYLDPLDKHFERMGIRFVRYADDISIITSTEEEAVKALGIMSDFLNNPLHLGLLPAKTNYVPVKDGFGFLGFTLFNDRIEIQEKKLEKAVEAMRDQMKILGAGDSTLQKRSDSLVRLNMIVRGFRNYFFLPGEEKIAGQLNYLDGRCEQMAHQYLPAQIRDDPAWVCRERFYSSGSSQAWGDAVVNNVLNATTGAYGTIGRERVPHPWGYDDQEVVDSPPLKRLLTVSEKDEKEIAIKNRLSKTIIDRESRLYVLTHGGYITMDGEEIIVRKNKIEIFRKRLADLDMLFLQGFAMNISVSLQLKLAGLDIPVVFAPPTGAPLAILNPIQSTKSFLRGQQVLRRDDPDIVTAGLKMLSAKVGNQAAILRYFAKYRKKTAPEIGDSFSKAAEEINEMGDRIKEIDPASAIARTIGMGYEGRAASLYWKCLSKLVPPGFAFEGRVTLRAFDIVNQCLNYVYGIMYGEVWRALVKVGLDPYFGIIHGSERNQGSLVFDLIEEFRAPFGDRLIFGLLGRGFKPKIGSQGFIKTSFKRQIALRFSRLWSKKIVWRSKSLAPVEIIERQAVDLVKLVKREGNYHPYRMRW